MKKLDLKIEKLCNKLEYIVKYGNGISVDTAYDIDNNTVYRIFILNSDNDIFSIRLLTNKHSYLIRIYNEGNYYKSSDSSFVLVDMDNENAKKLMGLVKDKYEEKNDKANIERIDKSLEILDRINDRIFKEV